jgi:hypothetical protein
MKTINFALALLTLVVAASCAGNPSRDLASTCKNKVTTEYHSYFDDYERCRGL